MVVADAGLFWLPPSPWQLSPKVSRSFPRSEVSEINTPEPTELLEGGPRPSIVSMVCTLVRMRL